MRRKKYFLFSTGAVQFSSVTSGFGTLQDGSIILLTMYCTYIVVYGPTARGPLAKFNLVDECIGTLDYECVYEITYAMLIEYAIAKKKLIYF